MKAPTVCNVPGCGEIVVKGKCPEHERERRKVRPRNPFYSTAGWDRIRKAYLKRHPQCERCRTAKATDVHHVDENTSNNLDDNLEALCHGCHSKQTLQPFQKRDTMKRPRHDAIPRGPSASKPVVGGGLLDLMLQRTHEQCQ